MGNCLVLQANVIRVMKTDGKILEYKAPMKVYQVLSEFANHAISDSLPVVQHLRADTEMVGGRLYYLLPLPVPRPKPAKKKVKFADQVEEADQQGTGVVRVKIIISKQELQALLSKDQISVDDMVRHLQKEKSSNELNRCAADEEANCKGWKPMLGSIPELD
nr:uncharacterized protein LOC109181110 [Ipomoea trifida]GMD41479.1 uncharacterized protein LOC109181110 [Ipomoea batatas]